MHDNLLKVDNNSIMYKFHPILKQVMWGGDRIVSEKQICTDLQHVGESWEISGMHDNVSVVSEGPEKGLTIVELIERHRDRLLGQENYRTFGAEFPLLVKFIDAHQDLSIQVHPNMELAKQRHGMRGKTEMWYVVDAAEGAHLCSGLAKPISKEDYARMVVEGTIADALHYDKVKRGDVYYLPAGRVHCIGAGCFVAEIQQASDITYRIFDYNRRDKNGNARELHTELAKDAIDFNVSKEYKTRYSPKVDEPVSLVESDYFTASLYDLKEPMECDYSELDSFVIYMCVEGSASLVASDGSAMTVRSCESVLVPASTETVAILPDGNVKLLEVFV